MPQTPLHRLPYPTQASPADVPADVQALAEATERELGQVEQTSSGATVTSGWALHTFIGRKIGTLKVCTIMIMFTRTGAALNIGTFGNVFDDPTMGFLPEGYRPPYSINANAGNGSESGEVLIGADGAVQIRCWTPGVAIDDQSGNIRITSTFILP